MMSWLQYGKVISVTVVVPEVFCATSWLLGFDVGIVRAAFGVSAMGIFISLFSVILIGFLEIFGNYNYDRLSISIRSFAIVYIWSTFIPILISFILLYSVNILKPANQMINAIDVLYMVLGLSLVVHVIALLFKMISIRRAR
jgi:hypothetical protein